MTSVNSNNKQKDKIIQEMIFQKKKIEEFLNSLKESIMFLQEGNDGDPCWNGENAYQMISTMLLYVDNGYAIIDAINECEKSLKKSV